MRSIRCRLLTIGLAALLLTSACSTLNRLPPDERTAARRQAREALQRLNQKNSSLTSFKGIGRLQIRQTGQLYLSERLVWVGALPDKLGLAVLVSGIPVMRIAADGDYLYFVDLRDPERSYRKIRTSDARLDKLIHIPVTAQDLVALLAGRLPIRDHSRAFFLDQVDAGGSVVVLEKWWYVVEKIYLVGDGQDIGRIEFFGSDGSLQYAAEFGELQNIEGYRVPRRIRLRNDDGTELRLEIERYYPDPPIESAMFVLPPP